MGSVLPMAVKPRRLETPDHHPNIYGPNLWKFLSGLDFDASVVSVSWTVDVSNPSTELDNGHITLNTGFMKGLGLQILLVD